MKASAIPGLFVLFASSRAQLAGDKTPEVHPKITIQKCTKGGACTPSQASITLDANWRWLRKSAGMENCYKGQTWDPELCTDPKKCVEGCALEGAEYEKNYGITTQGSSLTLSFVTKGQYSTNVGSRVYLMSGEDKYEMFKLKNQEFTFTVEMKDVPCGMNSALYFSAMEEDGGLKKYPTNKSGAKYGTGYCDAQCPHDIKFIGGLANVVDWKPSPDNDNTGTGKMGACCAEMDIWEANRVSQALTPHSCLEPGYTPCEGAKCGDDPDNRYGGLCDKDGCDFNPFRLGDKEFYGPKKKVDSDKKMTVVTQFLTTDGTSAGQVKEIRRIYVQDGQVIQNTKSNVPNLKPFDSVSEEFCKAYKPVLGDKDDFNAKGGFKTLSAAMEQGMVLTMSLWDDNIAKMQWLDGTAYPPGKPADQPGVARGTCPAAEGVPKFVREKFPNAKVVFSDIRIGDIDSTYTAASTSGAAAVPPPATTPASNKTTRA